MSEICPNIGPLSLLIINKLATPTYVVTIPLTPTQTRKLMQHNCIGFLFLDNDIHMTIEMRHAV